MTSSSVAAMGRAAAFCSSVTDPFLLFSNGSLSFQHGLGGFSTMGSSSQRLMLDQYFEVAL